MQGCLLLRGTLRELALPTKPGESEHRQSHDKSLKIDLVSVSACGEGHKNRELHANTTLSYPPLSGSVVLTVLTKNLLGME